MIITQNGEAKAVIQDVASYEETQETLALLKLLALGNQDVEAGRTRPLAEVVKRSARANSPADRWRHKVLLTAGAARDLESLYDYIARSRLAKPAADHVLDRLLKTAGDLATFPERGSHPRELLTLGIHEYRQVFFKPYRLIYRIIRTSRSSLYLIADGRRDMQTLLAQRLLSDPN